MASRPAHTLIFLGNERTDRVDLGRGPEFPELAANHQNSQGIDDPVARLEASLAALPRVGKIVWILWEAAGAHVLDMPAAAVDGLERQQLADTLSFEAETLTSVPAAESAIDGVLQAERSGLKDLKRYWITQINATMRDRFQVAVSRVGAKLAGIVHPGGLPRADWQAAEADGREWRRIEVWDQLTFILHGAKDGHLDVKVVRSSLGSKAWSAQLPTEGPLAWLGPAPVMRVGPGGRQVSEALPQAIEGSSLQIVKIEFPAVAAPVDWLKAWARELTAKIRRVPAVEVPSNVSPHRKLFLSGAVAASVVLVGVLSQAFSLSSQTQQARETADRLERYRIENAPADESEKEASLINTEATKFTPRIKELEQRATTLEIESNRLQKIAEVAMSQKSQLKKLQDVHRPSIAALLSAIAGAEKREHPGEIVIKEIRQDGSGGLRLTGLCSQSSIADSFATKLDAQLTQSGWKVGAAQKNLRRDRLAFDYSILLTPSVLDIASGLPGGSVKPAATQKGIARRDPASANVTSGGKPQ